MAAWLVNWHNSRPPLLCGYNGGCCDSLLLSGRAGEAVRASGTMHSQDSSGGDGGELAVSYLSTASYKHACSYGQCMKCADPIDHDAEFAAMDGLCSR